MKLLAALLIGVLNVPLSALAASSTLAPGNDSPPIIVPNPASGDGKAPEQTREWTSLLAPTQRVPRDAKAVKAAKSAPQSKRPVIDMGCVTTASDTPERTVRPEHPRAR